MTKKNRANRNATDSIDHDASAARLSLRDAVLIGAVQGATEFLPISSSAHLTLARRLLGRDAMPRAFDVALHAGTAAALMLASGRHLIPAVSSLAEDVAHYRARLERYRPASRLALRLGLATVPAVIAGTVYHTDLEAWAKRPGRIAAALAAGSLPIVLAESVASHGRSLPADMVSTGVALLMGIAQAAALAPGISRSGATVAAGMFAGLDRESAGHFSFLLAIPVTAAATARSLPTIGSVTHDTGPMPLAVALGSSLVTGLAGIEVMKRVTTARGLLPFALYRLIMAGLWQVAVSRHGRQAPTPPRRDRSAPP